MVNSVASLETRDTVLSISETVESNDNDTEETNRKKLEEEEEEEEENTDCKVYITMGILVVLCFVVIFSKVTITEMPLH